jgi:type I restriction enzyme, R subunit
LTPEEKARESIDGMLAAAGWIIQNRTDANIDAGRGVAIREFALGRGFGEADYLLFVDGQAAGVVEAKKEGSTLNGVEIQTQKYSEGIPEVLPAHGRPLPFLYQSTGIETRFTSLLEPNPSSRSIFSFHRPETLSQRLGDELASPGSALKARLASIPPLPRLGLRPAQITAIEALEVLLGHGRRRSLIQMATGAGKTYTACSALYRLIKFAGARPRVVPGRPRQPRAPDTERVPGLPHPG